MPVWDPGLQPERTLLAWNRTVLALVVGTVAMGRWFAQDSGLLAGALLALVLPAALWLLAHVGRRRERILIALHAGQPLPPGGRQTLVLSAAVALLAGGEMVHMLLI